MPISDSKKAQTIRNLWFTEVAQRVSEANAKVAAIRAALIDNSLIGEFTVPERSAMQAVETNLAALATLPGVTAAEGKYIPTHRSRALNIEGVN